MEERDRKPAPETSAFEIPEETLRLLSHQLKAPLNAIRELLNTVAEGMAGALDPKALDLVDRARHRADEATRLVSDLLAFQFHSGGHRAPGKEFDLALTVGELSRRLTSAAGDSDVSLRWDLPPGLRVVCEGDNRAVEQALENVIENAIRYTPSGGSVTVTLRPSDGERACEVRVSDTGPGITDEERERVFEPFYRAIRLRSSTTGTGLGLPIARKILESHGGGISIAPTEGPGATFVLTLPAKRVEHGVPGLARRRVVIIGGVTAGPKVAARLRRLDEQCEITIVEQGRLLSYTGCRLPHYISGRDSSVRSLVSNPDDSVRSVRFFESTRGIRALSSTRVVSIERQAKKVRCRDLPTGNCFDLPYDTLVLATGAVPDRPSVPGVDEPGVYTLYSLDDAESIKRELAAARAHDVAIVGAGLIGVSLAESLVDAGARVTILERRDTILADYFDPDVARRIQHSLLRRAIKVVPGTTMTAIRRADGRLTIVTTGGAYAVDLVILSTGVRPNVTLAREAGLQIGGSGGIRVDEHLRTSDGDVYAVGDCAETVNLVTGGHDFLPLGSVSTKMGRIAADNIAGRDAVFRGSIGTGMFRLSDLNVARTGLTSRAATERGCRIETALVTGLDRAHYSTDARHLCIKVIVDRTSRVILGAQGFGRGDVVGRIGVLACAITQRLSTGDVFRLDLGYHPAFNRPIDILQTACLAVDNKIDEGVRTVSPDELTGSGEAVRLVDVSPSSVHAEGSIPGSINVPLDAIRREELPVGRSEPVVLYSGTSAEAYEAWLYLHSRGYTELRVLEGGYRCWLSVRGAAESDPASGRGDRAPG